MFRATAASLVCLLCLAGASAARGEALPRPPELEAQVRFWRRIYSQVDTGAGLIHDSRHMDVIYEELRLPEGLSRRARQRRVRDAKRKYEQALRRLATGRRSGLSRTEQHVLALWPPGVSNATLRAASHRVRFQLGQADKFREGVIRAGLWEPYIEDVFQRMGVPMEAAALPHVESSFNPHAYSSAGAAGLWQFTRSTGRMYMRIDHVVDERFDPYLATEAAARLLLHNYADLERWPLAITAYNHGKAGMLRAVRRLGTRDITAIVERYRSRSFGFASRNFYAELLAAIDVERDAERHFGPLRKLDPTDYEIVELEHYYRVSSLEQVLGVDASTLREHNLSLRSPVWREQKYLPRGFALRVPRDPAGAPAATALAAIPAEERFLGQRRDTVYTVRRGDTLSAIARRFGVSQRELASLNGLRSRHRIRIGQRLRLPGVRATAVTSVADLGAFDGSYRVRRGDTLSVIARRFGVSQAELAAANELRNRHQLWVGQELVVPVDGRAGSAGAGEPAPAAVASAEAADPQPSPAASSGPAEAPAGRTDAEAGAAARDPAPEPRAPARVASSPGAAPPASRPPPTRLPPVAGGRTVVEPGETLGHYADWLELPTAHLRRLNGMRRRSDIVIGQRVRLDFSRVSVETFSERRRAYHRSLRRSFFDEYRVAGTRVHVLRRGDTLWSLSRRHRQVPIWLLRHYNPDLDLSDLRPGERLQIPRVERRRT